MRKIDAVITWVDGDDPKHIAKRNAYGDSKIASREDVGGTTRFRSVGEILYCVASLNRFAPWLNKIYIVTDEQDPKIDERIKELFPNGHIPMEIVDHKRIFEGYEEHLPTFNSISIESMTWRIPGLSEHFIEFNDDLILAAPTRPEDFFTEEGKVVCYGKRRLKFFVRLSRMLKHRGNAPKQVSYKESMLNATNFCQNDSHFIMLYHTPKALLRSIYEEHFTKHPDHLIHNIRHRFRHASQYNAQEIQYMTLHHTKRSVMRSADDELLYMKAKNDAEYVRRKLEGFSRSPEKKFGCFNSLDLAPAEACQEAIEWIERRLGIRE
ncbi:MAG: Stealth CR1 domain-containing protein [Alistipes sp.]|nr:Stealth CR1 domain-containing protein [Alistipes sp.]